MGVDVPRRDRLDAEVFGEVAERQVPPCVASLVRTLKLDEEPLLPERRSKPGGSLRVVDREPVACAAGQADETFIQLRDRLQRSCRRQQHAVLLAFGTGPRMRGGEDPAEVGVALAALAEQRDVAAPALASVRRP